MVGIGFTTTFAVKAEVQRFEFVIKTVYVPELPIVKFGNVISFVVAVNGVVAFVLQA